MSPPLLNEATWVYKAMSHTRSEPKYAKTLDKRAIIELSKEDKLLDGVTEFFTTVVKYYSEALSTGGSDEKKTLATATLMKALGRVLWNIADNLYGIKSGVPNLFFDQLLDRTNMIQPIMKDRFAHIEERYANHLERAGVFEGAIKKPKPKYNKNQEG